MTSPLGTPLPIEPVACRDCPVGHLSGVGRGQFCPFIMRTYEPGDTLCLAGDAADRIWYVKAGVVGLSRSRNLGRHGDFEALSMPASFIGLEALVGDRYLRSARVIARAILCSATRDGFERWVAQHDERAATIERALRDDPLLPINR